MVVVVIDGFFLLIVEVILWEFFGFFFMIDLGMYIFDFFWRYGFCMFIVLEFEFCFVL